jgi:hypothetical protein
MAQAVRGPRDGDADLTAPAMIGEDEWVCVDCDARQIEFVSTCSSCGGTVVSQHELEEANYDPLIGRKLGGRFTVVARGGAGSMGAVSRA